MHTAIELLKRINSSCSSGRGEEKKCKWDEWTTSRAAELFARCGCVFSRKWPTLFKDFYTALSGGSKWSSSKVALINLANLHIFPHFALILHTHTKHL